MLALAHVPVATSRVVDTASVRSEPRDFEKTTCAALEPNTCTNVSQRSQFFDIIACAGEQHDPYP